MKNTFLLLCLSLLAVGNAALAQPAPASKQAPAAASQEFRAGEPLGTVNEAGKAMPISKNVKVYGSFRFAESVTFDAERNLLIVMNAGVAQNVQENDGYVSLLHPDGSVHTAKWIGATRAGLTLNHPLGSALHGGVLYAADINFVRTFDQATGKPGRSIEVPGATFLNGIAVAKDGTIYVSNTRPPEAVYKITADGTVSTFVPGGAPLAQPNGVAMDPDGNVVVLNMGHNKVLTFDPQGKLVRTEESTESGNDGIVILPDGTKYVSSVRFGSVTQLRSGQPAKVIATGIPSAASMGYDSKQRQLVIPMNDNNALGFLKLTD